ncbi:sodium:solute symporter family protein [Thalassotalea sediminis]|uniref:sodium:solute symporter family protein n=1 Tax=Thalassotalea sediminis TaxID=1759089 RepID=UPI00257331F1|nr:sodium:solute symporter family protein [Thalassotalea sediminis]
MEGIFFVAFALYVLAMIGLSWWVSRRQKSGEDFLLGGRSLPLLLTLGTTVATMVGTGSSMGAVGFAYHNGWAGMLYGIGGAVGILLLAWIFAPVRKYQFMTMSEEIAFYVGAHPLIKNLLAVIIYIASIGWLGAHIIGGGMYLSWLTGLDIDIAKMIIAISFAIYVIIGGYTAVVWTDSIQALILFVGFVLMAYFSVDYVGGWQAMIDAQPVQNTSWFAIDKIGAIHAMSLSLAILVGILATPSFRQRIYSGKSVSSIRRSFIYSGVLYLGFSIIPAIIGMSAYAINQDLDNASFAFPHIALNVMPLALGVLIIIAGISATLSSASSDAIAAVSVAMRDLYRLISGRMPKPDKVIWLSRISLFFTIAIALGFALLSDDIISYITKMIAILMSGMCVAGLLGRFWPRYNWQGAILTLICSTGSALAISLTPEWTSFWGNPVIPAITAGTIAGIIGSLLTPISELDEQHALDVLAKERKQME